jgi:hypothetical protein
LMKYYESNSTIFLLIEYLANGKLFAKIHSLQQSERKSENGDNESKRSISKDKVDANAIANADVIAGANEDVNAKKLLDEPIRTTLKANNKIFNRSKSLSLNLYSSLSFLSSSSHTFAAVSSKHRTQSARHRTISSQEIQAYKLSNDAARTLLTEVQLNKIDCANELARRAKTVQIKEKESSLSSLSLSSSSSSSLSSSSSSSSSSQPQLNSQSASNKQPSENYSKESKKQENTFYLDETEKDEKVEKEEKIVQFNMESNTSNTQTEQANKLNKFNKLIWPLSALKLNNKLFTSSTTSALFQSQHNKQRANSMTTAAKSNSDECDSDRDRSLDRSRACKYTTGAYFVQVKLWLAQILCALTHLHDLGVLCKDLNPDNLLLSASGDCVLTYFSRWNLIDEHLDKAAVENFYVAPGKLFSIFPIFFLLGVLLVETQEFTLLFSRTRCVYKLSCWRSLRLLVIRCYRL